MAELMYLSAASLVLALHLFFILWVIFGAFFTRGRPLLTVVHIASFIWGLVIEIFPWTCPLTFAENWLEQRAGIALYSGGFLLHYLDALVYPSVPPLLLTVTAIAVFTANLAVYWRRWRRPSAEGV
jgi:hypothetical protein